MGRKADKRIIVVDGHTLVRDALVHLLNKTKGLRVVASSDKGADLDGLVEEHDPDLVLLSVELPDGSGITFGQELLSHCDTKLMLIAMHRHEEYALRALRFGAHGYFLKTEDTDQLLEAIQQLLDGDTYISEEISARIAHYVSRFGEEGAYSSLSAREFTVLQGLAEGKTCKELAQRHTLSPKSIYGYRKRVFEKLGVQSEIELLRYVLRHKLQVVA